MIVYSEGLALGSDLVFQVSIPNMSVFNHGGGIVPLGPATNRQMTPPPSLSPFHVNTYHIMVCSCILFRVIF